MRNNYEVVVFSKGGSIHIENIVLITSRLKDAEKKAKELVKEFGYTRHIEIYKNGLFYRWAS